MQLRRRVVLARVAAALPAELRADVVRESYSLAALSLLWMMRLDARRDAQTLVAPLDERSEAALTELRALLAGGGHAVVASGHVGFWEILPTALAGPALPVETQWVVYRPLHDRAVDELVTSIRQAPGRHLIADKKCYGLLRGVLQRPNADGNAAQLVGLVADQRCNSAHTRAVVTFLGQPTHFPTGAARLHLDTGATLWFAAVVHNKRFYETSDPAEKPFQLVLRPISTDATDAAGESKDDTMAQATELVQTYASMLERVVLEYPEQYMWMHDLWGTKRRAAALVE